MALLDPVEHRLMGAAEGGGQQFFKPVGDAAERGVDHQHARPAPLACTHHGGDIAPGVEAGDARAAELEHDPG